MSNTSDCDVLVATNTARKGSAHETTSSDDNALEATSVASGRDAPDAVSGASNGDAPEVRGEATDRDTLEDRAGATSGASDCCDALEATSGASAAMRSKR